MKGERDKFLPLGTLNLFQFTQLLIPSSCILAQSFRVLKYLTSGIIVANMQ